MSLCPNSKRWRILALVGMVAVTMVVPSVATAAGPIVSPQAGPAREGLREVGRIPFPPSYDTNVPVDNQPTPMIVDPEHNLGFMVGAVPPDQGNTPPRSLMMYDLETLEELDRVVLNISMDDFGAILTWAVDTTETRLIVFGTVKSVNCPSGLDQDNFYYDYEQIDGRWRFNRLTSETNAHALFPLPCGSSPHPLLSHGASVYVDPSTGNRKLYILGSYGLDDRVRGGVPLATAQSVDPRRNTGSPFFITQIDLDTLATDPGAALDWQIDLHKQGCGRFLTIFVARVSDSVLSYCHDTSGDHRTSPLGEQGYVVRIPLDDQDLPFTIDDAPVSPPGIGEVFDDVRDDVRDVLDDANPPPLSDEILNPVVRRIPTLPGTVQPFADPGSGRVLLLTDDHVNGEAVWVLDPLQERFIGVMTPGDPPPRGRQARPDDPRRSPGGAGFNTELGRAYVYGVGGIIVASGRQEPPMAGTFHEILGKASHPLQAKPGDRASKAMIAVAPELGRLFVPMEGEGYVVLEDTTPEPPPSPGGDDLDRFTTQVDEKEGVTEANTLSEAEASGLHVVIAGGTSNVVNPNNPLCAPPLLGNWEDPGDGPTTNLNIFLEENGERAIFDGSCLAERFVSRGNRDFSLGYTATDGGTSTGVEAEGQGVAFSSSDSAGDRDVRNAGECYRSSLHASSTDAADHLSSFSEEEDNGSASTTTTSTTTTTTQPGPFDTVFAPPDSEENDPGGPYSQLCQTPQERIRDHDQGRTPDLNTGTQGRDGDGFPAPRARCSDATNDSDRRDTAGMFRSEARCDGSHILGRARSTSVGLGLPSASDPMITVEEVTSSVDTRRTPDDGTVTVAHARADGVRIGPLHIGTVWSKATAKAHGRTGTAHGDLQRAWCDVSVNGEQRFDECKDVESDDIRLLVDAFNQTSQKLRLSVPAAEAEGTPGGYQGVVIKDPAVAAADQTVNEDDSLTVPALQATFYNDNAEGRSRTILQFAGVRSESSYGIILLPQFDTPEVGPIGEFTSGAAPTFSSLPINRPVYGQEARPPRFAEQLIAGQRPAPPESTFRQAVRNPVAAALQALEWLRQHPREAALLFFVFSILGLPVYLIVRRRTFERALLE